MTRINVGVFPEELPGKLLLAEHREIKRIPNTIANGKVVWGGAPPRFTLGTGHVKFFYHRINFLRERYLQLHSECVRRGYKVSDYSEVFDNLPSRCYSVSYVPSIRDRTLIVNRIRSKGFELLKVDYENSRTKI